MVMFGLFVIQMLMQTILARCDSEHHYMSNGDDGYKLVKGTEESYTVVDTLGDFHGRSWFRLGYLWSC